MSIAFSSTADTVYEGSKANEILIYHATFDDWEWIPITQRIGKQIKARMKNNDPLSVEIDEPAVRHPVGWEALCGIMVKGQDAFKGNSVFFETASNDIAFGYHTLKPLIKPEKEYCYEIWLKGKGKINFLVWREAINNKGEKKLIGVVPLFSIAFESADWKKFTGTGHIRPNENKEYPHYEKSFHCAFVIDKNSKIYMDEFKLFELNK